ncbi:insulinase family protein [Larkinella ripae]
MKKILATGLILALLASGANAQKPKKTAPKKAGPPARTLPAKTVAAGIPVELKQPIPFDPDVKVGKLPNGLTYYIRKNTEPKNRAELRLAINAGSILETDDQQGLAHFMEHMAFNGTKNFPKNELISFLQSSGVRFGADLNASTGFDETIYQLPVPTDSARLFERAFQILEDWAHNVTMDPAEIEKERGVILEEARSGRGAGQRMREKYYPLILNNARYASRLPIGKDDVIKTFKPEALQRFYKDWYRPDLMAVVAVGDFDVTQVEEMIKAKFGRIPAVSQPKPRLEYPVPPHKDTKIAIVTDPEQPNTLVQIMYKRPEIKEKNLYDVREAIKRVLFNSMIGNRINELTQQSDPPFLAGYSNYGGFLGDQDAFSSYVVAKDGNVNRAVTAILDENARVDRFGFTETELDRAKKQYQKYVDRAYRERDKTSSNSYVSEYVEHFLNGDVPVSISFYNDFIKKYLGGITVGDVNNLAKQFITTENRAVVVMAPENRNAGPGQAKLPTEKQILALIDQAGKNLTAYVDKTLDKPLLATLPVGNPVTAEKEIKDLNVTEWTLRNGVRVVLKPTDFRNDQIIFSGNSPGGSSLYENKDFESARFASALAQMSGIGEYSQIQLGKYLTGKTVSVAPYIGETSEGISGSTTPDDLETALQLVYAYFTAPRRDADVIKGFLSNQRSILQNQQATPTPQKVFQDTVQAFLGGYHFRRLPLTPDRLEKVDAERAISIYKDRFADAGDFTFFFVGNFKEKEIKPLIEKYLGALPVTNRKEKYRDLGIRIPAGKLEKTVTKGIEPKSTVQLVFSGDFVWNAENATLIDALAEALEIKLTETLREEESGVYGVSVGGAYSKIPAQRYTFRIGFGCAPENVDKLTSRTLAEIEKIKQNGADPKDIDKFKAETRRETELRLKQNNFWLSYLSNQYFNDDDPKEILHEDDLLKQVTPERTKQAANQYFGPNFIKLLLQPERKQ